MATSTAGEGPDDTPPDGPALATRLLVAAERGAAAAAREIEENLSPQLSRLQSGSASQTQLTYLVQRLSDGQAALRAAYTVCLGRFCLNLLKMLLGTDILPAVLASLRLVEGVLLICIGEEPGDTDLLVQVLQPLLRRRHFPQNAVARVESAVMSLLGPGMRSLYAPEVPSLVSSGMAVGDPSLWNLASDLRPTVACDRPMCRVFGSSGMAAAEASLWNLVSELRPTVACERRRRRVFLIFNDVIFDCFGVRGREFGSGVNGFQMKSSDIDISVELSPELRERLLGLDMQVSLGTDTSTCTRKRLAATVAVRFLAEALGRAGISVRDVVENARVPIVKCFYVDWERNTQRTFEVDISFGNDVVLYNSQLLRAYADFDQRAMALGILVKHWAKQRGIRSPLEGTLSSYSYSLMVIHFLQLNHVLPNFQNPPETLMAMAGLDSAERLLEEGHNVWFLNPGSVKGDIEDEDWLGCRKCTASLPELFFGFFRYFALEFNFYSHVVSIRLEPSIRKLDYFRKEFADDGEMKREDEEVPVDEDVNHVDQQNSLPAGMDRIIDSAEAPPDICQTSGMQHDSTMEPDSEEEAVCPQEFAASSNDARSPPSSPRSRKASTDAAEGSVVEPSADSWNTSLPSLPKELIGRLRKFSPNHGYGFISCPATHARFSRDVFVYQRQFWEAEGSVQVGDLVSFKLYLTSKGRPQARNLRKAPAGAVQTRPVEEQPEENVQSTDENEEVAAQPVPTSQEVASSAALRLSTEPPDDPQFVRSSASLRRIASRPCLCIDDPMEKHRTLGTTFAGQDALSTELRRAVNLLKRGEFLYNVQLLLEEGDQNLSTSMPSRRPRRDYSPIPMKDCAKNEVEMMRAVRWDFTKLLSQGKLEKTMRLSGVQCIKLVSEADQWFVLARGELENVQDALHRVDVILRTAMAQRHDHPDVISTAVPHKAASRVPVGAWPVPEQDGDRSFRSLSVAPARGINSPACRIAAQFRGVPATMARRPVPLAPERNSLLYIDAMESAGDHGVAAGRSARTAPAGAPGRRWARPASGATAASVEPCRQTIEAQFPENPGTGILEESASGKHKHKGNKIPAWMHGEKPWQ